MRNGEDEDWFGTDLDPLMQDDPEEVVAPQSKLSVKSSSPEKTPKPSALSAAEPAIGIKSGAKVQIKVENTVGVDEDDGDEDEGHHCCGYTNTSDPPAQHNIVDLLDGDDTSWLDFDRSPLISPSMPLQKLSSRETKLLLGSTTDPAVKTEEQFLLPDETDYSLPEFTDDEVSAMVGPSSSSSACSSTPSYMRDAMPQSNLPLISPQSSNGEATSTQGGQQQQASSNVNSITVSEKDIPDMVNLFSSMYSPSEAAHHRNSASVSTTSSSQQPHPQQHAQPPPPTPTHPNSLSILVPAPQMYATMFPFSTTAASAANFAAAASTSSSNGASGSSVNQFDYFTPPGFTNNRYLVDGSQLNSSLFLSAETLSPPTKGGLSMYNNAANAAAQSRAFAQVHAHAHAAAAAAVAMANSAAAINTMRKLNTTYGVPIAPLQRSLHPELKPKLPTSSTTTTSNSSLGSKMLLAAAATSSVSSNSSSKVTKISITPDISDFKLVQIYHNFCDPASKVITLTRFQHLLHHHQVKDDPNSLSSSKANSASTASNSTTASKVVLVSQETQSLFKVLDPKATGYIDLERFMSSFQICNRCTEAKRRAHSVQCASQGQSFVSTALERQLMEDVAPVIVRVVPTSYEGSKVKSCEHYQWTWCEGFEKTGNEKCRGTNRHDKCPKYLANCTLWKHKLPPKNRKAKVLENQESPSKKFKHFA